MASMPGPIGQKCGAEDKSGLASTAKPSPTSDDGRRTMRDRAARTRVQVALRRKCRQQITVRGLVQGVGFRPFVYALATELQLTGCVRNCEVGVSIEVEGE